MDNIVHPKPCSYNLNGDCIWMRAYAMLCAQINHPDHGEVATKHVKSSLGTYHHYIAGNLDMNPAEVQRLVEGYAKHFSVGANGKDAEDEGAE